MSFWDNMFDTEMKRRRDIDKLKHDFRTVVLDRDDALDITLRKYKTALQRQDLLLEALIQYLERNNLLNRAELAKLITQIDLMDGVEDGKIGKKLKNAPKCPSCMRPVNPKRVECIYCGQSLKKQEDEKPEERKTKFVRCISCFCRIEKEKAFETIEGPVCLDCK